MEKILGYTESKGEFNGLKYHNYIFTSQYEPNPSNEHKGVNCKQYKVKGSYLEDILKKNQLNDISEIVGKLINDPYSDILYDSNKRIKLIVFK